MKRKNNSISPDLLRKMGLSLVSTLALINAVSLPAAISADSAASPAQPAATPSTPAATPSTPAAATPSTPAAATPSTPAAATPATPAAATPATPAAQAATASPTDSNATTAPPLQAGVQMIELNLQMLRDVGLDIKNLIKASSSLYDEVTIQPVSIITQPEVVGRGIIINIPVGTQPVGPPAPPKKARVDLAMGQMRPIVSTLKKDVDEFEAGRARLDISDDTRKDLHPYFDDWMKIVNAISDTMKTLEGQTQGPPYSNSDIQQSTSIIHNDAQKLDEVRRKIYKYLQKEGRKKSKKNA